MKNKFYGNQYEEGIYDVVRRGKKSFWKRLKEKVKRFCRKCFIALCIIFAVWLFIKIIHNVYPNVVYKVVEKEVVIDNLSEKINQLKGEIISNIKEGESHNAPESAGIIIFDSNKVASIGSYQFQTKTVIYYYKKLYDKTITNKEAILIALDDIKAGELCRDIVFKEKDGWRNWYNVGKKYGIESKLQVIANLEK